MENLTPQEVAKLKKIADVIDRGNIAVMEHLVELENKVDELLPSVKDIIAKSKGDKGDNPTPEELLNLIRPLIPEVQDGITPTDDELVALIEPLIPEVQHGHTPTDDEIRALIAGMLPETPDIEKLKAEILDEAKAELASMNLGIDFIQENELVGLGPQIRDGLEMLVGDDRLAMSAIKGLEEALSAFKNNGKGGGKNNFVGVVGVVGIVAGTGITVDNSITNYPKVSVNGGGNVTINFIIDGGGSVITTGVRGFVEIAYNMTITGWQIFADQSGSAVVDVWRSTYAGFPPVVGGSIAGSEKPTLTATQNNQNLALTTWTTALLKGDILSFNVSSMATVQRLTVTLVATKS